MRIVCAQVVSKSSASLAPWQMPWSKMLGLGAATLNGGSLANPTPPCTPRELLLKSVTQSRAALQLLIRVSCAPSTLEYRLFIGIVWRGPSPKIQVTPSARPSSWHEPQELQASSDCLPRKSRGSMSRTGMPTRPLSGTPSAVKNTSLPTIRVWSNEPGSGSVPDGTSRRSRRVALQVEHRNRDVDLVVDEGQLPLPIDHDAGRDVARLEADDVVRGVDVELAVVVELRLEHEIAAAADDEEVLAVGVRVDRHDVIAEQLGEAPLHRVRGRLRGRSAGSD